MNSHAVGAVAATLLFAPLGIPLHVEIGRGVDPDAVAVACEAWRGPAEGGARPIGLRIARSSALAGMGEPRIVVDRRKVEIAGPGAEGWASVDTRLARCTVSDAYLASPDRLLEEVLEPLLLFVLAHYDRTPLHASGFVAGGLAVLTSGPSGTGKSSLALAADAAGWPMLSDDTVYVQRRPQFSVWGLPRAAHLLPEDGQETAGRTRLRGGQLKSVVPFRSTPGAMARADCAALCLLTRGQRVSLEPLERDAAMRRLGPLDEGFDLFVDESAAVFDLLTRHGAWSLTLSDDPAEAIRLLGENLPRLRQTAAP